MEETAYHIPALLQPTIDALITNSSGDYVDATMGGGGHTRAILQRLSPSGRLYGFDRDSDAFQNIPEDKRFTFVHSDFRFIRNFLRFNDCQKVDGILADLGVSFHHFDTPERGFSFRTDAPLDMRMNQKAPYSAADIINTADERRLTSIFRLYGELKNAPGLAKAILSAREKAPIETTSSLRSAVCSLINPRQEKKELAQIFQALRIEVNDELGSLKQLLLSSLNVLKPGGRMAILTYHSLEDRLVKNFFRSGSFDSDIKKDFFGNPITPWHLVGKNPILPSEDEILSNPRSRSAKLRVAEFISD
ncbi:MAG: 16S rRNA (cytosine(1402)-N(4))-methyltransferase RsmH [Prevotella sp.]|nr:16S rRNA (cytosine(1402)-N(4))-methyltransferase RsmH [Bacteroides sp.]MCM1366253.1 16S rRNA (cytosine(1402)-N(4))-methyltransferase RsmH [Prevotella sp.]MCM1436342.1 16S rRNA (cytosine(1402)-N(4))-methyltransferase RsmH [Prevotella sp.]